MFFTQVFTQVTPIFATLSAYFICINLNNILKYIILINNGAIKIGLYICACYRASDNLFTTLFIQGEKMLNLIYSSLLSVLLLSTSFAGEAMNSAKENEKASNYYISISHGKSLYSVSDRIFDTANSDTSDKQDKSSKITFGKVISLSLIHI